MRFSALPAVAALAAITTVTAVRSTAAWDYPPSPRGDHVDHYHGTAVPDPYRWLEDLDSAATRAWVEAQNAFTDAQLARIPERALVKERLLELSNYPRTGVPEHRGPWYYYTRNDGLQNQSPLYVRQGLEGEERVLIDPNTLSEDGTVAIPITAASPDGRWMAYGLARAGSDWREIRLREIASGEDAADEVRWAKFTDVEWTDDSRGFFYSRYPAPADGNPKVFSKLEHRTIYYHRVGTPQAEDVRVYALPDHPQRFPSGEVSSDGRYLIISTTQPGQPGNALAYLDLQDARAPRFDGAAVTLIDTFDQDYTFLGNSGTTAYVLTNAGAPRGRIVAFDLAAPAGTAPREIVAESEQTLQRARISAGRIVVSYLRDATSRIALFDLAGRPAGEIPLPGIGSVTTLHGRFGDPELFLGFSSYVAPGTILRHDLASGQTTTWHETKIDFDLAAYEVRQVFYPSKDGTRIPLFLVAKKGLPRDGRAPAWLYGYGGFNVVLQPQFSVPPLVWIERGGIFAVACLRGGGEYGEAWHLAGTKERKQNVFDDFIAAADWLVAEGYTAHDKLVLDGRSNGGLLLGAVVNQRPDLCAAAVPAVGVMDMLRYHTFTVGAAWAADYGTSETPEGFRYLSAYSPVHTVKPGAKYPAILVTTGDHDDRVYPAHSYKYTAAAQHAADPASGPILIHIETNAGHGGSSGTTPVSKTIEDWAMRMGFAGHHAGWGR